MNLNYSNDLEVELVNGVTASDTSLAIKPVFNLPFPPFRLTFTDNLEIVEVTSVDLATWALTVIRGLEGTVATSHPAGTKLQNRLTRGSLEDIEGSFNNPSFDVFNVRTIAKIAQLVPKNQPLFCTDMVSWGKEVFACIAHMFVIQSSDEGITWRLASLEKFRPAIAANLEPHFLVVDEYGLEGEPGGIYCLGGLDTGGGKKQTIWYRAPNQDEWVQRQSATAWQTPSGFAVGRIGMAVTYRLGNPFVVRYSTDFGVNWNSYSFTNSIFATHTHDVWASPWAHKNNFNDGIGPAVYVTGGDQYDGRGGVMKSGDFLSWTRVIPEFPGFRIVPVYGNQRFRMFGAESTAGTVFLLTRDDTSDVEVRLGKFDFGYLNFRSLKVSNDGLIVAGSYQYLGGSLKRQAYGGTLVFSSDEGLTFKKLHLPTPKVSGIAITPNYVFAGGGWTSGSWVHNPYIYRIPRTFIERLPRENKVCLPSWLMPRDATTAECRIAAGSNTLTVNATAYKSITAQLDVEEAGTLEIQGRLYADAEDQAWGAGSWHTLKTEVFSGSARRHVNLKEFEHYMLFRVKNVGGSPIAIREALFFGTLS